MAEPLSWAAEALERVPAAARSGDFQQMADLAAQLAERMPDRDSPLMRALSGLVTEFATAGAGRGDETDRLEELTAEETALTFAQAALMLELEVPGTVRTEDLEALVDEVSKGPAGEEAETAMRAAMSRMAHGVRMADADRPAEAAELIGTAAGTGSGPVDWMAGVISPGLLTAANILGGNLTDRDQARARLDALFGRASAVFDSTHATGPGKEPLKAVPGQAHNLGTFEGAGEANRLLAPLRAVVIPPGMRA
ncbi:hypothetical protein AB0M05_38100 [Streptomyces violaceusniger]|uniref:hypothetical protein n=1 Tax=Streptomyces violaceusniger TaxID=68280 RepID=UPI00342E2AA7